MNEHYQRRDGWKKATETGKGVERSGNEDEGREEKGRVRREGIGGEGKLERITKD